LISALISCLIISLGVGDVRTIPAHTRVCQPGCLNWNAKDRLIPIPVDIRAMVVRIRPESVEDAIEVRFLDGTDRLGWLEPTNKQEIAVRPKAAPPVNISSTAEVKPNGPDPAAGNRQPPRPAPKKRRYPRQDHDALTAQMFEMANGLSSEYAAAARRAGPIPFAGVPQPEIMGLGNGYGAVGASGPRTQHVSGYPRADGTHVNPYYRRPPR
jgi:hypothetical protein